MNVLSIYLKYETTTSLMVGDEHVMPMPSLAECFLWTDILDRSRYKEYNISKEKPLTDMQVIHERNTLKVGEIFNLTPKTNELIKSCQIREEDSYQVISLESSSECHQHFSVEKFLMQEYMCYLIQLKNIRKFRVIRAQQSMNYVRLLYEIFLNKKFDSGNEMYSISFAKSIVGFFGYKIEVDDRQDLPFYSRNFGQVSLRFSSEKELKRNVFFVSNQMSRTLLQPYPYDTDCVQGSGRWSCLRLCLKEKLLKINKVPFTSMTEETELEHISHLYPIKPIDFMNKTLRDFLFKSESFCSKKCSRRPCRLFFTKTLLHSFLDKRFNLTSRIRANCPDDPTTDIITVINFDLYQLIIFISSSFSIWFGISLISLDPVKRLLYISQFYFKNKNRGHTT